MKKLFFALILFNLSVCGYAQCAGTSNTGTVKGCFLVISQMSKVGSVDSGVWNATPITISKGGTGATTATGASNALLPSQTSNSGKFLTTNGTDVSWATTNVGTVTSIGLSSTDLSVSGSPVTTSGNITANLTTTGVASGTYNSRVTVDTKGRVTAADTVVISTPARSLSTNGSNNTFTVSATRKSFVSYSINFSFALAITTSNGQVDLDYSYNGGGTWINVASVSNVYSVAVTLTGNSNAVLCGWVPPGALVRVNRTQNTNVTVSIVRQQEMID